MTVASATGRGDALARAERERDDAVARGREVSDERESDAREASRHLRNVLSVVRSLAQRTADETQDLEDFLAVFDGRLTAFARVQSMMARDVRAGMDLGTIVGDTLLSFGIGVGDGVELAGDPVRLTSRAAGLVALVTHEIVADFATGDAPRSARVVWTDGDGLDIDWFQPFDDARAAAPLPDWVRQAIAYELKGDVSEHRADGELRRRIRLPRGCRIRPG